MSLRQEPTCGMLLRKGVGDGALPREWLLLHDAPINGIKFSKHNGAIEGLVYEVSKDFCLIDSGTDEYGIVHAKRKASIPHCEEDLRTLYHVNDVVFIDGVVFCDDAVLIDDDVRIVITSERKSQYSWAASLMCPQSYVLHDQGTVESMTASVALLSTNNYGMVQLPAGGVCRCRTWNRSSTQLTDILNIGDIIYFRGVLDDNNQFKLLNAHVLNARHSSNSIESPSEEEDESFKHRCEVQDRLLGRIMRDWNFVDLILDRYPWGLQEYKDLLDNRTILYHNDGSDSDDYGDDPNLKRRYKVQDRFLQIILGDKDLRFRIWRDYPRELQEYLELDKQINIIYYNDESDSEEEEEEEDLDKVEVSDDDGQRRSEVQEDLLNVILRDKEMETKILEVILRDKELETKIRAKYRKELEAYYDLDESNSYYDSDDGQSRYSLPPQGTSLMSKSNRLALIRSPDSKSI